MGFLTAGKKETISRLTAGNRIATKGCSYRIRRLTNCETDIEECTSQAAEKLNILSTSITSVIPEGAKRLSGMTEKTIVYWIPDLDFVSSGMTCGLFSGFCGSLLVKIFLKTRGGKKLEYRLLEER